MTWTWKPAPYPYAAPSPRPERTVTAESYVAAFADSPSRIRETARADAAYTLSLGDGPRTEDERLWLADLLPSRHAQALFLFRVLWRRPEGLPSATSEHVLWVSPRLLQS